MLGASSARPLQSPPGLFCEVRYLVGRCSTLFAWARSCLRNREDILIPWRLFCQVKYGWPAGAEGPQSPALHAKLVRAPHPKCGCDVKNSVAGVLVPPCPSGCRIPHIIPALVHGSKSQVWQRWVDFQYAIAVPNYGIETQPRYETPGVVSQWTLANTVSTSRLGAVSPQTQPRDLARPTHSHGGLCSGRSSLSLGRHLTKPWVCDVPRSIAGFFPQSGRAEGLPFVRSGTQISQAPHHKRWLLWYFGRWMICVS